MRLNIFDALGGVVSIANVDVRSNGAHRKIVVSVMRILLVAPYFPPQHAVASLRSWSMARQWSDAGAHVTVLTTRKPHDPGGLRLPLEDVQVIEMPLHYPRVLTAMRAAGKRPARRIGRAVAAMQRLKDRRGIYSSMRMPDLTDAWVAPAAEWAERHGPWDAVVSSSGPYTAHLVARTVRSSGAARRWIAEFRDLWCDHPIYRGLAPFTWRERQLERKVLAEADRIVTVSEGCAAVLSRRSGRRVDVVFNGFDELQPNGSAQGDRLWPADGITRLVYTGTFYPTLQDPEPLLRAMASIAADPRAATSPPRLVIAGHSADAWRDAARRHGIESLLDLRSLEAHEVARQLQNQADALILLDAFEGAPGVLTAKVFEYLSVSAPILIVGGRAGSEVGALVHRAGRGVHLGSDEAAIERTLRSLCAGGLIDEAAHPDRAFIGGLSRDAQARRMFAIVADADPPRETRRRRIAAVVMNSVSHDARVLKQADALAEAGYDVAVFGIQDERDATERTARASGAVIHRCPWQARARTMGAIACATAAALLALAAAYIASSAPVVAFFAPLGRFSAFARGLMVVLGPALLLRDASHRWRLSRDSRQPRPPGSASTQVERLSGRQTVYRLLMGAANAEIGKRARRRGLVQAVLDFGPDAVHCHDLNTVAVGLSVARRLSCAVVWDSHELYEDLSTASRTHKVVSRFRQRAYSRRIDAFVTINESIAGTLIERYPRLPPPVIVKNAAICPTAPASDDGRMRRAAGIEGGRRILLYQGGFSRFRGLEALVRAGARLPESWVLVMMGWGSHERTLRRIASECDPGGRCIRFLPPAPHAELLSWTAGAQLGVIPYENVCLNHWFCTPNKLWEYPAAGVPILVSPFPEMSRVVHEHGIGKLLDNPVSSDAIANAVSTLDDRELSAMRERCREYIQHDNWSLYARRLVDLYGRLLVQPAGGSA